MITWLDMIATVIGVGSYALFWTFIEKTQMKLRIVIFFWVYAISYVIFLGIYLIRAFFFKSEFNAIEQAINHYTFENIPYLILIGSLTLICLIYILKLLKQYSAIQVISLSQISIFLTTSLFFLLKIDTFSWYEMIGVIIMTISSILISANSLDIFHPIKLIQSIPKKLWQGGLVLASLKSTIALISVLLTERSIVGEQVIKILKYAFPIEFHDNPLLQNLGIRFYVMICFFWYVSHHMKYQKEIIPTFKKNFPTLIVASLMFLIATYGVQVGYMYSEDITIMSALAKLNMPFFVVFGRIMLNEKITPARIIAPIFMIVGGILMASHHI